MDAASGVVAATGTIGGLKLGMEEDGGWTAPVCKSGIV